MRYTTINRPMVKPIAVNHTMGSPVVLRARCMGRDTRSLLCSRIIPFYTVLANAAQDFRQRVHEKRQQEQHHAPQKERAVERPVIGSSGNSTAILADKVRMPEKR